MSIIVIFAKLIDVIVVVGQLAIMIGLPILLIKNLFLMPILCIRKEMKSGKTFRQAWKEVFKNSTSNATGHPIHNHSTYNTNWHSSDYTTNSLYSSMPGNIYNRR